ncbi:MAG: H4MPT-linked C1 transfer pathway protein [Planctomycetia bacterium]|nr:H4MPT-linked C1 transfer pathway protein [Planctomycetia bacterium]
MLALGLDIGGANLKAATSAGQAHSEPFEIWRAPQDLTARLRTLIARFRPADVIAVTMTAELADCFATKREGVAAIIAAACDAVGAADIIFWQTTGRFAAPADALRSPRAVAAANWHALATWAGRLAPLGKALLVDLGSTTTDLIPLEDGRPAARGATDLERLTHHELVYTGARRTPLCALTSSVPVCGHPCGVAAELFATTLDACLVLGLAPEDESDRQTADGRPATIPCAHDRIAHMVCCDREEIDIPEARSIARHFLDAQRRQLSAALDAVVARDPRALQTVILSGSGEFLAKRLLSEHPLTCSTPIVRLAESLSPALADAACAHAVAVLALERSREPPAK